MSLSLADALGWIATAVFVGSYFFSKSWALRGCQMLGAALWIAYGIAIAAEPVIAANLLVLAAAAWTMARQRPARQGGRTGARGLAERTAADT